MIEDDEVRVRARAQRALLVLDIEASERGSAVRRENCRKEGEDALRGVVRRAFDSLAERAAGEVREVAHAFVESHNAAEIQIRPLPMMSMIGWHVPSSERIRPFDVQPHALLDDALPVPPIIDTVAHLRIKNLHC